MRTALSWDITQRVVVIPYRRFGTTYRSNLQDSWHLKMEPVGCPETSARNYHHSLRSNVEDRNSRVPRFFPRVKFTPPSSAEVENKICVSTPPSPLSIYLRRVDGDKFTFFKSLFTVFFLAVCSLCMYELCIFNGLTATLDLHRCACVFTDRWECKMAM